MAKIRNPKAADKIFASFLSQHLVMHSKEDDNKYDILLGAVVSNTLFVPSSRKKFAKDYGISELQLKQLCVLFGKEIPVAARQIPGIQKYAQEKEKKQKKRGCLGCLFYIGCFFFGMTLGIVFYDLVRQLELWPDQIQKTIEEHRKK